MSGIVLAVVLVLSSPAPTLNYWIAECQDLPSTANTTAVVAVSGTGSRVAYELLVDGVRVMGQSHYLGEYNPAWSFWSVRGPVELRAAYAALGCTVIDYSAVPTLVPTARRKWIIARSTCYGEATWRGVIYTSWPCIWDDERSGEGVVTTLSGVGPGVLAGGDGAQAAGAGQ